LYLLLLLIVLVALYVLSRNYMNNTENLNKDMYPLKALLPIGLMLQTKLGFRYNSDYNKKIKIKLGQISGFKNTDYFIKIFWSEKIIYLYLYLIFATTIITLTEPDVPVLIFLLIILYITWILPDSQIDTKIKKRTKSIEMDFPDFVQQTSLLTGAGLPVINALKRISDDSIKTKKHHHCTQN
jgi:tight adherence protein C